MQKRIQKRGMVTLIILVMTIGMGGCMGKTKGPSGKELALAYMEEKYHEEFEYISGGNQTWDTSLREIRLRSPKFPKSVVTVNIGYGNTMSDNYMDFLMKETIQEAIGAIAEEIYPQCKVIYNPGGMPIVNGSPELIGIAEYSKLIYLPLSFTLLVYDPEHSSNRDGHVEQFVKILGEKEYKCKFQLFYIHEDQLQAIEDDNWRKLTGEWALEERTILLGSFSMNEDYTMRFYGWREINQ